MYSNKSDCILKSFLQCTPLRCFINFAHACVLPPLPSSFSYISFSPACSISFLPLFLFPFFFFRFCLHVSISHTSSTPPPSLHPCLHMQCLGRLHGWRKGKERIQLVWIIHAALMHKFKWDPPHACPADSLLLSRLPLFTCSLLCCLCGFSCLFLFHDFPFSTVCMYKKDICHRRIARFFLHLNQQTAQD